MFVAGHVLPRPHSVGWHAVAVHWGPVCTVQCLPTVSRQVCGIACCAVVEHRAAAVAAAGNHLQSFLLIMLWGLVCAASACIQWIPTTQCLSIDRRRRLDQQMMLSAHAARRPVHAVVRPIGFTAPAYQPGAVRGLYDDVAITIYSTEEAHVSLLVSAGRHTSPDQGAPRCLLTFNKPCTSVCHGGFSPQMSVRCTGLTQKLLLKPVTRQARRPRC
jgi:hypothetical protein